MLSELNGFRSDSVAAVVSFNEDADTSATIVRIEVEDINNANGFSSVDIINHKTNLLRTVEVVVGTLNKPKINNYTLSGSVTLANIGLVTSVSSSSTDNQFASAKCLFDITGDIESLLAAL